MFLKSKFLLRGAAQNGGAAVLSRSNAPINLKPTGLLNQQLASSQHTSNLFTYPFYNKFGFATRRGNGSAQAGAVPEVINEATIDDSIRVETADDCKDTLLTYLVYV
jgi:hypothetical protein